MSAVGASWLPPPTSWSFSPLTGASGVLVSTPETSPGSGPEAGSLESQGGYRDLGTLLPPWALGAELRCGVKLQDVGCSELEGTNPTPPSLPRRHQKGPGSRLSAPELRKEKD